MKLAFLAFFFLFANICIAQNIQKKNYTTLNIKDRDITIDGVFDEPEWQMVGWENNFIQHEPVEGATPYQQTEFAVLYDENNVYVAFKCLDSNPDSISMRVSKRDAIDGDLVGIFFDTYFDKRTAFAFIVSAAGVKSDFVNSNDGENEDNNWDPIWWVKTMITVEGWNAEMRIPLTQLRFDDADEHTWGLQALRLVFRKDELSAWQPMQREKSGFASQFGTIKGINNIEPKRTLDLMPYVVAKTERFEKVDENPFKNTGKRNNLDIGLDAKIGLTNFLTLDLTVNPDFGQVEADPSEVNLSTYETFFEEKRPFFIEGKNILTYKLNFGDGNLAYDGLFYSRRIGRKPASYPDLNDNEYADVPNATSIIGAAKITGKTKNGWSVGVLESVTAEETASIRGSGNDRNETVEPMTNYFIGRLQKDFNEGNTYIGGMLTAVNRNLNDTELDFLHKGAYSGGIDFVHKWNDKKWELDFSTYFSHVTGSADAITRTQKSFLRTFQRPGQNYMKLDTTKTSLSGQGGKILLAEFDGNQKFMFAVSWKTPGLELNDVGYLQSADNIMQVFWTGYRFYKPFLIFRQANLNLNQWLVWDFGGNLTEPGGNINGNAEFKNYWSIYSSINIAGTQRLNSVLRGGPTLKVPGYRNFNLGFNTNQQKKFTANFSTSINRSLVKDYRKRVYFGVGVGYRPSENLSININPGISRNHENLQYVTQKDYLNNKRYVMAKIEQNTVNMSVRINYNITPDLSIQYWGQPFIATGEYSEFKYITNSLADELTDRYQTYTNDQISLDDDLETYLIDDNKDGITDYRFDKPDFNVKEFLSNLVVRWEYRPGSTFYLVWSQTRNHFQNTGNFDFSNNINDLFDVKGHDIFLVKFSYRIGS